MKKNYWGKTLLHIYKYLPRITEGIDKLVDRTALNSFYYYSNNQADNSVLSIADKLIELVERKKRLVNIKVLVDKCLLACDSQSGQILIQRYMDNDTSEEIAQRHNLNIRTYFRRLETSEGVFYRNMARLGYNEEKLNSYLADEKWIIEVYKKFVKEDEVGPESEVSEDLEKFA